MNILLSLLILLIPANQFVVTPEPVVIEMPTTRYSAIDSCHYEGCLTAAGIPPTERTIACPRDWELLTTRVEIDGEYYICHDRYNKDLSDRIDIWTGWDEEAHELAINYGVQIKKVRVIK